MGFWQKIKAFFSEDSSSTNVPVTDISHEAQTVRVKQPSTDEVAKAKRSAAAKKAAATRKANAAKAAKATPAKAPAKKPVAKTTKKVATRKTAKKA